MNKKLKNVAINCWETNHTFDFNVTKIIFILHSIYELSNKIYKTHKNIDNSDFAIPHFQIVGNII